MNTAASSSLDQAAPTGTAPPAVRTRTLRFHGRFTEVLGILVANGLLTAFTLGIYHAWGRVKLRRYLFSNVEIDGHPLSFHGTGGELFVAWLKVVGVLLGGGVMMGIAQAIFGRDSALPMLLTLLYDLGILFVIPYVVVSARRYVLSRTEWRNNRFAFLGNGPEFAPIFFKGFFLTLLTLGFYGPIFTSNVYAYLVRNSYYGDRRFGYDGEGRELLLPYVKAFFLAFVTFGLSLVWFQARRVRYLHQHTTFASVRFDSTVTGGKLLWLAVSNALIFFVCLMPVGASAFALRPTPGTAPTEMIGFGAFLVVSYVIALVLFASVVFFRLFAFNVENIVVRGDLDVSAIGKNHDPGASALGDQMADALDVGAGLGM